MRLDAFHLSTPDGFRFCVAYRPAGRPRGGVVHAPAFAEEMNKARRMVALQARALAEAGYLVLLVDPLGTGDSSGDFGEATWTAWVDDVVRGIDWMESEQSGPTWVWGLRTGCLLARTALDARPSARALLWQPVLSGNQYLRQFLRTRIVADRTRRADASSSVTDLLAQIDAGQCLEISGYRLAPDLARGLRAAEFSAPAIATPTQWFEVRNDPAMELPPPVRAAIQAWQDRGCAMSFATVVGPPFWQTQEIEVCPALLEQTTAAVTA